MGKCHWQSGKFFFNVDNITKRYFKVKQNYNTSSKLTISNRLHSSASWYNAQWSINLVAVRKNNLFQFVNSKTTEKSKPILVYVCKTTESKFPETCYEAKRLSFVGLKFLSSFRDRWIFSNMNQYELQISICSAKGNCETNCSAFTWWLVLIVSFFHVKSSDSDSEKKSSAN